MSDTFRLLDPSMVLSPGLLFDRDVIARNIHAMIARVGSPERLRPHVKTHKTREIIRMQLDAGITRQKCATIAEAELAAQCAVPDVLLAYPLVGPNCDRFARLVERYPTTRFSTIADAPEPIERLSQALGSHGVAADVLIDVDVGQHRTGAAPAHVRELYVLLDKLPALRPAGLHVYDGHNHQHDPDERRAAARRGLEPVLELRAALERDGLAVPRLVLGGTPTFPAYADLDLPGLECSPGTCVLNDDNYGKWFRDLSEFAPAALLLTRVVSRPTPQRVTFDLGYKAVASDPPAGKRCHLLDVGAYEAVLHNEEHLVIETPAANRFRPGDVAYAVPAHVCPTSALHQFATVVAKGEVVDRWEIAARDRALSV